MVKEVEVIDKSRDGVYGFLVIPEHAEVLTYTDQDLQRLNKENKFKKVYRTAEHVEDEPLFKNWSESLFPDVRQLYLGECFFDAAILGLIATDRYILQDMIIDNQDGTCTVRLYDWQQKPKYYRIDKTDFSNESTFIFNSVDFSPPFHAHAPWVCYLEKAYAIHRFIEDPNKKPLLIYLDNGDSIDVIRAFTGCSQGYDVPDKFIPLSDRFYFPAISTIYDLKVSIKQIESEGHLANDIDVYVLVADPQYLNLDLPFNIKYGYKKCILTYADKLYFYNSKTQAIEEIVKNVENEAYVNTILNRIEKIKKSHSTTDDPPTNKIYLIKDIKNDFREALIFLRGEEFFVSKDIFQFLDYLEHAYLNRYKNEKDKKIQDIQEDIQKIKDLFVWYNSNITNTSSQYPDIYDADFAFVKFLAVTEEEVALGIVDNHAYAVLNMYVDESKNEIVLRIVNPWKFLEAHTDEKTGEIVKFPENVRRRNLSAEFNSPKFFQHRLSVGYMPENREKVYAGVSELRFALNSINDKVLLKTFCSTKKTRLLNDLAIFCACMKSLQVCEDDEELKIFIDNVLNVINSSEYSTEYKLLLLMNYINTNKPQTAEDEINELLDLVDEVLKEINNKVLEEKMDEFDISIFGKIVEDVLNEPDIKELVTDFRERFNGYLKHFDYDSYIPSA